MCSARHHNGQIPGNSWKTGLETWHNSCGRFQSTPEKKKNPAVFQLTPEQHAERCRNCCTRFPSTVALDSHQLLHSIPINCRTRFPSTVALDSHQLLHSIPINCCTRFPSTVAGRIPRRRAPEVCPLARRDAEKTSSIMTAKCRV